MNAKRKAWQAQQAAPPAVQRQYQIDVTHYPIARTSVGGCCAAYSEVRMTNPEGGEVIATFLTPPHAERYAQQLATELRMQGHRVFRTIQS